MNLVASKGENKATGETTGCGYGMTAGPDRMAATDGVAIGRFSVRLAQLLRTTALCLEEENLLLDCMQFVSSCLFRLPHVLYPRTNAPRQCRALLFLFLAPSLFFHVSHPGERQSHTNRVVLEHAQRSMLARSDKSLVVTGQGHGDDAHRDGA